MAIRCVPGLFFAGCFDGWPMKKATIDITCLSLGLEIAWAIETRVDQNRALAGLIRGFPLFRQEEKGDSSYNLKE